MRKLSTTLAIVGLLSPAGAQALGVGEIRLQSALNQNFRAEIPLVLSRENLGDLKVTLAPPSEFAKAGVDRPHVLTRLRFEPVRKPDGSYVIRVASNDLIHEPFISFLLEMTWPEGRMLRSFTVLLDPPDVMAKTTLPSSVPRIDPGEGAGVPGVSRGYRDESAEAGDDGSTYGPVRRNEKLWSIAEKLKPDVSITTEQMVMALLRYNPDAFSAPNVNALDSGAVLRIPDEGYIRSLSASAARHEFYQQGGQHSGRWSKHAAPSRAAKSSPPPDALPAAAAEVPGPLPSTAMNGGRSGVSSRAVEALKGETEAMGVRLAELERRISEMQTRLDEKDALLAQLQAGSDARHAADHAATGELRGNIPPASAPQSAPNAAQPGAAGSAPQSGAVGDAATASAAKPSVIPAGLPTQEASPQSPAQVPNTSAVAQTIPGASGIQLNLPLAKTNPAVAADVEEAGGGLLGAFGVAMATAFGGLLFWRRKLAERESVDGARLETFGEAGNAIHRDGGSAGGDLMAPNMTDGMDAPETFADDLTAEPAIHADSETKGDSDEVDPVFESDVYLAYGRYKQAEEAMQNAIQEHPERDAYRLKLLEIYLAGENKEQFEEYAAQLRQRNPEDDDAFWQKVAEMGQKLCPESPLFRAEADVPANETPADFHPEVSDGLDETDRLIADLKSFSLGAMEKSSQSVPNAVSEAGEPAKASEASHEIEWAPVDFTAPPHKLSVPDPAVEDRPASIDGEHRIGFDPSEPPPSHEGGLAKGGDAASQSIDEILKELSAIHYKRHSEVEELGIPDAERPLTGTTSGSSGLDDLDALDFPEMNARPDTHNAEFDVEFPEMDDLETRLDLARAYADLEDYPQAIALLEEVIQKGTDPQKAEAAMLMGRFSQA